MRRTELFLDMRSSPKIPGEAPKGTLHGFTSKPRGLTAPRLATSLVAIFFALTGMLGATPAVFGQPIPPSLPVMPEAARPVEPTVIDWAFNPVLFKKLWEGSLELGINGTDGNSENSKFRIAGGAKRETETRIIKFDFLYSYASLNGTSSENRSLSTLKNEWLFPNSPWSVFVTGSLETDEFKAFDLRLSAHTGVAYAIIKNDRTLLKSRAGLGFSREIGGPDNEFKPELMLGGDFEHKLTERQKLGASVDIFPNFRDFSDFRSELKAAWEILIDPEWHLTLKLGVTNRYDSTPEGRKKNDFEYFGVLMWKF